MPTEGEQYAAMLIDAIKFYRAKNPAISKERLPESIFIDITSRSYDHFKQITKQRKAKGDATPEEIKIYEAYPRKVARGDGVVAIRQALGKVDAATLLAATRHYAKCVSKWPASYRFKDGRDLVPNPATWFNRESYSDDPRHWLPAGMFVREDDDQGRCILAHAGNMAEPTNWREVTKADPDYAMFSNREWPLIPDFYKQRIIKLTSTTPPTSSP